MPSPAPEKDPKFRPCNKNSEMTHQSLSKFGKSQLITPTGGLSLSKAIYTCHSCSETCAKAPDAHKTVKPYA